MGDCEGEWEVGESPSCFWGDDEHVRSMIFALKESN